MFLNRAIFMSLILGTILPVTTHAAIKKLDMLRISLGKDVSNLSGVWSIGNFKTCKPDASADSWWCIKNTKCGDPFSILTEKYDGKGKAGDEYVRLAWVARTIKEGGAEFCPTEIRAANKEATKSAWLEYYDLGGKCYWVCKDGYAGSTCGTKISASSSVMCNPDAIDFQKSISRASAKASNIAMKIPMFRMGDNRECDKSTKQEHDMILMAVPQDDHTMIAQAMIIRSGVKYTDQRYTAPFFSTDGSTPIPLCMPGYKPKANGTSVWATRCEPIDKTKCDMESMAWCDGFTKSEYNKNKSAYTLDTDGDCIKFKCANSKEGFPAEGSAKTCSKCNPEFPLGGVNSETGRCVACESGEWFDENTGVCVDAKILTKIDMQYGPGKTKNASTNVEEQCWTMVSPDDYVKCMADESDFVPQQQSEPEPSPYTEAAWKKMYQIANTCFDGQSTFACGLNSADYEQLDYEILARHSAYAPPESEAERKKNIELYKAVQARNPKCSEYCKPL